MKVNRSDSTVDVYETKIEAPIRPRIVTVYSTASIIPTSDTADEYTVTALEHIAIILAPSGTPTNGQKLLLRILDDGTARKLSWDVAYNAIGVVLPLATVASKYLYVGCIYNTASSKWDVVAIKVQS